MNKKFVKLNDTSNLRTLQLTKAIGLVVNRFIRKFYAYAELYAEYRLGKKAIHELEKLDDRLLRDIGIDRSDVIYVANSVNPGHQLKRLNHEKSKSHTNEKSDCSLATTTAPAWC